MKAKDMKLLRNAFDKDNSREIMRRYPDRTRWAVSYFLNELACEIFEYQSKDLTFYLDVRRSIPLDCQIGAILLLRELGYDVIDNDKETRIVL